MMKQFMYTFFFILLASIAFSQNCDDIQGQQLDNEGFDNYPTGDFPAANNSNWTLWSTNSAKGQIKTSPFLIPETVLEIKNNNGAAPDLLYLLGNRTTGRYRLSWSMSIATTAYYHIQHGDNGNAPNRAARIYFEPNGSGRLHLGSRTITNSNPNATFTYGAFNTIEHIFDLDQNRAELRVNGNLVHTWAFSEGETSNTITLGAINFFARSGNDYSIDDICFTRLDVAGGGNESCEDCGNCFTYTPDGEDPQLVAFKSNFCGDDAVRWSFRRQNGTAVNVTFVEGSGTSLNPICRFPGPGIYEVCFTDVRPVRATSRSQQLIDFDCCVWVVIPEVPCQEESPPVCFFNYGEGIEPASFNFDATNATSGNQFNWSFEDEEGNSVEPIRTRGTDRSPTYSFASLGSGCYTACLYVSNACGMSKFCIKVCVNTSGCNPVPQLVQRVEPTVSGDQASFSQVPNIAGATYNWTVPEDVSFVGSSASSRAPTCRFPETGFYVVCVEIKTGCHTICYCWTVSVGPRQQGDDVIFDCDDDICGFKGDRIKVPVRVRNFEDILLFSQSIRIGNGQVARFAGTPITNILSGGTSSTNRISNTRATIAWGANNPITRADGTILYELDIELIGAPGESTSIFIEGTPTDIEVVNGNGITLGHDEISGSICIEENKASIIGNIYLPDRRPIGQVFVPLRTISNQVIVAQQTTSSNGQYEFSDLESGINYDVEPQKSTSVLNGVDARDRTALLRHVSGVSELTTAREAIAADVNRDGKVNLLDGGEIVRLVGNGISQFSSNKSWCFIPSEEFNQLTFTSALQHAYAPRRNYTPLDVDKVNQDFVGIKLGDLTNDVNPATLISSTSKVRFRNSSVVELKLSAMTGTILQGEELSLDLLTNGFEGVSGFQFSINWNPEKFRFKGISNFSPLLDGINDSYFTNNVEEGVLTCVWTKDPPVDLENESIISTFNFEIVGEVGETDSIKITGTPTKVLVFDGDLNDIEVTTTPSVLEIVSSNNYLDKMIDFEIAPNPSKNGIFNWRIGQQLNEKLELSVYNTIGKLLQSENLNDHSLNNGTVNLANYPKGIYIFTLRGVHTTISKKLIIQD